MNHGADPKPIHSEVRSHTGEWVQLLAFSVVIGLLMFGPMLFMFEVYGRVLNSRSMYTLGALLVLLLACIVLMEGMEWLRFRIFRAMGLKVEARFQSLAFEGLVRQTHNRGFYVADNPIRDLKAIRDLATNPGFMAIFDLPSGVAFVVFLGLLNPWLALVAVLAFVLQTVLAMFNARLTKSDRATAQRVHAQADVQVSQAIAMRDSVLAMHMQETVLQRWSGLMSQAQGLDGRVGWISQWIQSATRQLQLVVSSALLGLAAWFVMQNDLAGGAGMMIVASTLGARVLMPIGAVVGNWGVLMEATRALDRLNALVSAHQQRTPAMELPPPTGDLRFEGVSSHPDATSKSPLLKNISFHLPAGTALAVVGPMGSGKSSLLKTMLGNWPCSQGAVRLDGADVFHWDKQALGRYVGYLPQEIELFEGTVAENIARFGASDAAHLEASLEALSEALDLGFVSSSLGGMKARLQDEGANLSAGQRQKLGIARAFYGEPVLIGLDEPTSRLDEASERLLMTLIRQRCEAGATIVFATHRMSMLEVADQVLLLEKGGMKWMGSRDEFVATINKRPGL